ncbi:MAG: hypothetical protein KIS76_03005 [Pyrinomonadaceae bacterium]|nr:hypothetical protein [Pyrinomonadaceae bacterium]
MSKTAKELAFLRDLTVDEFWTARFTENFDKNYKFTDEASILYLNAGTGGHVLALREQLDNDIEIYGVTENEDLTVIAKAKAEALKADVGFSTFVPPDRYDLVIADASFVAPSKVIDFIEDTVHYAEDRAVIFLPTAGSFGEIFSMLWEVLIGEDLFDQSGEATRLIEEIPTVSRVEEIAKNAGLKKVRSKTEIEIFEFEKGEEFVNSTLIADFLMPQWFDFLNEKNTKKVKKRLAKTIDENCGDLTFRFTVKSTMIDGVKG